MKTRVSSAVFGWLLIMSSSSAHHNFVAYFDIQKRVTIEGVVTEVRMANPHSRISVEVEGGQGETELWLLETGTPRTMAIEHGWTPESLPVGARVTAEGFPAFSGNPMLGLIRITFPDGSQLEGDMDEYLRATESN